MILRGIEANVLDCGILLHYHYSQIHYHVVISEFKLQSRYYDHFRTNTLKKGMNRRFPPVMG